MKKLLLSVLLSVSTISALPAFADVTSTINLPVELKDPFSAYSIGLIPFYSQSAANYVGTSRLSWQAPNDLNRAAIFCNLIDVSFLGSSIACLLLSQNWQQHVNLASSNGDGSSQVALFSVASLVSILAIPVFHASFCAPYWGSKAVEFNRNNLKENGFKTE